MAQGLSRTARIACVVGAVLAVFAVWVTVASPNSGIGFFFCIPVGLAAWWFGPRAGLLLALICLGLYVVGDVIHPVSEFALAFVLRGVFFLAVAALAAWLRERMRALEHSAEELEAIRAALAPAALPDIAALVGHGPAAARLATFIRARLRPGETNVSWARAGHPPPLLLPGLAELPVEGSTFLLGAEEGLQLENAESSLDGSEGLVVYTDGATEVRRGRQMLGLEGLRGMLLPLSGLAARVIVTELERAILAWADRPIRDDLCVLVLKPESRESG